MRSVPHSRAPDLCIGCAGWSIPAAQAHRFPAEGTHLERYAQVFDAVEINSSFYRPHRPATYRRWAAAVPADFRFAVKMPRTISHLQRLGGDTVVLDAFLDAVGELGDRLGCLLLQLPPSLHLDAAKAHAFFAALRRRHGGAVACEPRHPSWFGAEADTLLRRHGIARAAADPARTPRAAVPAADRRVQYLRLHGAPRVYYDAYPATTLARVARWLTTPAARTQARWCIFDNTALGHATADALALKDRLIPDGAQVPPRAVR